MILSHREEVHRRRVKMLGYLDEVMITSSYRLGVIGGYDRLPSGRPKKKGNFMSGTAVCQPLVQMKQLAMWQGINPETGRTCNLCARPWVKRYLDRFGRLPSMETYIELQKERKD